MAYIVISILLLVIDFYLWVSLFLPHMDSHLRIVSVAFVILQYLLLSQAWFFFIFIRSSNDKVLKFEKQLLSSAFHSMGIISFLFIFTLLHDFLNVFHINLNTSLIITLSLACYLFGILNVKLKLKVMSVFVPLDNIPKNLNNLKIVQLSDIHIGTSINTKQLENIVCKTNDLNPDIITLTGDIIDGDINKIQNELLQLKKLKSKYGIYYVLGNHECYWNALDSLKAIKELGFITLENQGIDLEISGTKIFIAGMNDPAFAYMGGVGPSLPKPPQDSKFNLMLMHQPQFSKMTVQEKYHLQLSGHTHGGQFFPWNFVVRLIYKISSGLGKSNNLYIYVNQGTGYWGPPIRLGTVCEISQIFLKSK